ncbi:MAG TPA: ribosome small subunit-dependent GTPase A [Bryobacteraceae bacterium]|nr:ribosome small subunit-dependent GTPase A [Bryobacteraceae bacterium]
MFLESIGADAVVFGALQSHAAAGLELGRVAVSHGDRYHLYLESGELEAEPSGSLWYRTEDRAAMPVTGDWVAARKVGPGEAIVEAVLPRRTCFSRRAAGTREEQQPVAANIDLVFLVCGLDGDFNLRRLERYLALAVESGVQPVVVLNKSDLCAEADAARAQAAGVAGMAPVVICSARETGGIDALRGFLRTGRTVALLGSSGVGKSTIVNRLMGEERMRTREVRLSDSRGRHTTTHRELLPLDSGGALIDTPGMREVQLWAGAESVEQVFGDVASLARNCRYRDCSHTGEPECAVAGALAAGTLAIERWESYRKLRGEAQRHEWLADRVAAQERKRRIKQIHRAARQFYKSRS